MLRGVIGKCLDKAIELGAKSIAFPTLGCGKMKYPVREVARCFRETCSDKIGINVSVSNQ